MVGVTVATGVLALFQDSRVLVVLGVAGGFLAPLLAATETGSHVLLFSYYAVLNAAILAIAWFKAWRPLNLLGFAFTFVIGSLWGYQAYRPEHFATTEPFLVLFVLMYIAIAVLFALRRPPNLRGFVDSALVFGTPLVGFTLQSRIVDSDVGLAWTAGSLAALYALLTGARMADQGSPSPSHVVLRSGAVVPGDGHPACLGRPLDLDPPGRSRLRRLRGSVYAMALGCRFSRPPRCTLLRSWRTPAPDCSNRRQRPY